LGLDDSEEIELFFFIIPPFIPHRMANPGGKLISILVDPLSFLGRKLNALYEDPKSLTAANNSIVNDVYAHIRKGLDEFETTAFFNNTIAYLNRSISKLPECRMDKRIRAVVTRCQEKDGENIVAGDLAKWTSLSESRARHLFKEETGVPFTQYLKWLRMMKAIKHACTSGKSLTDAAHMAGFSDSAHLSRMFKQFFGLMPSSVLQ
jgi:AraC-like DNA-binding protein